MQRILLNMSKKILGYTSSEMVWIIILYLILNHYNSMFVLQWYIKAVEECFYDISSKK